jgi:hypothetical protein
VRAERKSVMRAAVVMRCVVVEVFRGQSAMLRFRLGRFDVHPGM